LPEIFSGTGHYRLIEGDFLKTWKNEWQSRGTPDAVLGNLPYNVGSVMILALLKEGCLPGRMVFTVQKEVAQRMAAKPGTKSYSSFSVLCQYQCEVSYLGDIQAGSFYPPPRVVSSLVRMKPHGKYPQEYRSLFFDLANDLFAARRKTVKNNLLSGSVARSHGADAVLSALEESPISEGARGEELDVDVIFRLAELVNQRVC
jgi:16S rRNA (adenine1518-N6/adenine1519-N6)-dimethyltransferase